MRLSLELRAHLVQQLPEPVRRLPSVGWIHVRSSSCLRSMSATVARYRYPFGGFAGLCIYLRPCEGHTTTVGPSCSYLAQSRRVKSQIAMTRLAEPCTIRCCRQKDVSGWTVRHLDVADLSADGKAKKQAEKGGGAGRRSEMGEGRPAFTLARLPAQQSRPTVSQRDLHPKTVQVPADRLHFAASHRRR